MNPATKRTSDSTDDSAKVETKKKKKHKRKEKKNKKKKRKHQASDSEPENHVKLKRKKHKRAKEEKGTKRDTMSIENEEMPGPSVPVDLLAATSKTRTPITKEEWEKSQSVIRRVYDETGRSRLIKGDGEILEEIVSKERHREINRQATLGDGLYFQSKVQGAKK